MKVFGITGGIASGVSLVCAMFRELGATVIEADQVAREVVEPGTEALRKIVEAFGKEVLQPDGALDRRRLGQIVFRDDVARRRLNAITHPEIRRRIAAEIERIRVEHAEAVVIIDIPLLLDTTGPEVLGLEGVIVVKATPELQIARVMSRNKFTRDEAERRLDSQRPVTEKAAEADWVIDNTSTIADTREQVEALWKHLSP